MRYGYYPGCSLHSTAAEYEYSTRQVCEKLGITLEEIPDWNCCGASSAHSTSHLAGVAIPARNLALAEEKGLDVVAPCAACYQRLVTADYEMKHDPALKAKVEQVMDRKFNGTIGVKSTLEAVVESGLEKMTKALQKPLKGLKIACYYGCYLVKPPKIAHVDDPENPMIMDNIFRALGAETVDWPYKTECCSGSLVLSNTDITLKLARDIMQIAADSGANCIATPCPLCQPNLDMRVAQVNKKYGTNFDLPIFYFTELMALAFGVPKADLKFNKHFVEPTKLLADL
ncbi:MAG: CoB--CoM heterodisulfide reductase iron-sulfur subunit B family protein [Clostridia bacterium]|nr:CoB--CoM heterodisulfide reductase iron-sulfur subunit B family protein [Clostridia bacterium]